MKVLVVILVAFVCVWGISAEQCGRQAKNRKCPGGLCCSQYGYCGSTQQYCGVGCQSQCKHAPDTDNDITTVITPSEFTQILNSKCANPPALFNYDAFVNAARSFTGFATTGDMATRKNEVAAFLAQTIDDKNACAPSKLAQKYDIEAVGKGIGADLARNPELVSQNPVASYQAAIWYWMTPQAGDKPSHHDLITTRN